MNTATPTPTVDIAGEYGTADGSIHLLNPDGSERVMWDCAEWIEDPSLVYVIVNAVVQHLAPAASTALTETLARFREHAADIVDPEEFDPDDIATVEDMEAATWLAAADELRIALGLPHPDEANPDVDTASSASRQHYIETGRYLRTGEDDVCTGCGHTRATVPAPYCQGGLAHYFEAPEETP